MRWPLWIWFGLLAAATPGHAESAPAPRIDIKIEQPAYAGLPIWLNVDVQDACLEAIYHGDLLASITPTWGFAPYSERAEVKGPGKATPGPGFPATVPRGGGIPPTPRHACPGSRPKGPASAHLFPLHIAADLRQPGHYSARWVIPDAEVTGIIAKSAWVSFTVLPSTPSQREAWLQNTLSHPPATPEAIIKTYIPSLLAAWDDPRVTRRMLELTCSTNPDVSRAAASALPTRFNPEQDDYLIHLAAHGCSSRGLSAYLSENGRGDAVLRVGLTDAVITRLKTANLNDAQSLIGTLLWLENGEQDNIAARAEVAVLSVAPLFVASQDVEAKGDLIEYLRYHTNTPGVRQVLRTLALQENRAAEMALDSLVEQGEAEDLPTVSAALSGPLKWFYLPNLATVTNLASVIGELAQTYDKSPQLHAAGMLALHDILTKAQIPAIRDDAALTLAQLGDPAGLNAVIGALRGNSHDDTIYVLNTINNQEVPCPEERELCYKYIEPNADLNAPWITARREAALKFYASALEKDQTKQGG